MTVYMLSHCVYMRLNRFNDVTFEHMVFKKGLTL